MYTLVSNELRCILLGFWEPPSRCSRQHSRYQRALPHRRFWNIADLARGQSSRRRRVSSRCAGRQHGATATLGGPVTPVPGLTAPSGAFSGKPAGAQYRAQLRARAPEPRWGRAVPHSLRPEVAGSPCWLLARAWRILAVVLAAQDAHNWQHCCPLWASAPARLDRLDRS